MELEPLEYADALTNRLDVIERKNRNRRKWRRAIGVVGLIVYSALALLCGAVYFLAVEGGIITHLVFMGLLAFFVWRAWAAFRNAIGDFSN